MPSAIRVMGILNTTPDSFSDGGKFTNIDQALEHVAQMIVDGADIIDIGGESTRPGAQAVSVDDEIARVIPIVQEIRKRFDIDISVDTSKAEVMREAISAGVSIINDVRALREPGALDICKDSDVDICLMHMQGQPRTMQALPIYESVVDDIYGFLREQIEVCTNAGIANSRLIIDPGFGFGKTLSHNLELLAKLNRFKSLGVPMLVGISRKSMIGTLLNDAPVDQRSNGSLAANVIAAMNGASIIRTHDVKQTNEAMKIAIGVLEYV
ncbi:MAG: Dihydropteroate synthase (EC [uncultured Thiotrichaceae bacterium]|uniref:Dihydropteroate synthase n=1 Tax=uncultured Thiotrichaceae bacterium TaxID=298394 RepID=A0A6S6TGM8_9GAMM|nr:MAG: Dihydropteroate synthase (EC [uncultured Thiotrichaceae bacterium]